MKKVVVIMKSQLLSIINHAIRLNARNIHFRLAINGVIHVHFREGNFMLPTSCLEFETYKKIVDHIECHMVPELSHKGQIWEGILTLNDHSSDVECHVSILLTSEFKSLILRIKKTHVDRQELSKNFENIILQYNHLVW